MTGAQTDAEAVSAPAQPRAIRRRAKLAETVARSIERDVLASGWEVGAVVGDESQLMERYSVSRAVIREAIRLVERHQVAAPRRGRGGGLVVGSPVEKSVIEAIGLFLDVVGVSIQELTEARVLLETLAIRQAVDRLTEEGIAKLRESAAAESSLGLCGADQKLHSVIVDCAGDPVIRIYLDALIELTCRHPAVVAQVRRDQAAPRPRLPDVHKAISAAIIAGDVGLAQRLMTEHLSAIARAETSPGPRTQEVPGSHGTQNAPSGSSGGTLVLLRGTRLRSALGDRAAAGPPDRARVSDAVLDAVLDDVRRNADKPGTRLGSETELMRRYGASRAALRETVRLLEHLGVAEMRRGTAGGLVITEPIPDGVAQAVALYLEYLHASPQDLQEVRIALELHTVDEVVSLLDGHSRDRLAEVMRNERRAGSGLVVPVSDGPYLLSRASKFHFTLADLSRNPATQVFVRPLIALTSGGHAAQRPESEPGSEPPDRAASAQQVRGAHQGIIEAILADDRDLAVHRMRKHLSAVFKVTGPAGR